MPLRFKIILTVIVLIIGGLVAAWEFSGGNAWRGWVVLAIMAVMVLGQWVFPEAGGGKSAQKTKD